MAGEIEIPGEPKPTKAPLKEIPRVSSDKISALPPDIVASVRKAVSKMKPNTWEMFVLNDAENNAHCYMIARDHQNRFFSRKMFREENLDSDLVLA